MIAPGDAEAFAAAVRKLADDPAMRQSMGRRARQALAERWCAPIAMRRWETLLRDVVTRDTRKEP